MTYNNLFQIPDGPGDTTVPTTGKEVRRAGMPAVRVGTGRIEQERPAGLSEGLDPRYEFSTGARMRPMRSDDPMLIPDSHGGRLKLAVMLALVAILIVSAVAGVIAFAAGQ